MNILRSLHNSTGNQDRSWATTEALAILAVDNIRPTPEGVELMHAIDRGEISHDEAILIDQIAITMLKDMGLKR